jgi:hypothetical protein
MLDSLDDYSATAAERARVCTAFDAALAALGAGGPRGDRTLVAKAEGALREDPGLFRFDEAGVARLEVGGREFVAGRFACRSLKELSAGLPSASGRLRLFVIVGQSPITDIGALQGSAPPGSMFQAASQFNCLESPGPHLARVSDYFFDPTQGPRASISAWPATLLRHFAAPGEGGRFAQSDPSPQLNLLHRVAVPPTAEVASGYLMADRVKDPEGFAKALKEHFLDLEVGVHEQAEVVLGANWDGPVVGRPLIGQVFTSTLAAGGYSRVNFQDKTWLLIARQLQRAAYLGTLLAAATTGQRRVVLTLIGGGVFGNPIPLIWDSILWACRQMESRLKGDLTVILNGRELPLDLSEVQRATRDFGGDLVLCAASGARIEG